MSLAVFETCSGCAHAAVYREPNLPLACPRCGEPLLPARRAQNRDWQVRLIAKVLDRALNSQPRSASGKWGGLTPEAIQLCERVRDMACADRWHKTVIYGMATALITANHWRESAEKAKNPAAYTRHRHRVLKALLAYHSAKRGANLP